MDAKKPSRELSVSEIISLTFNLYRSKFTQFFLPFLVQGIIIGIIYFAITSTFPIPETPAIPTSPSVTFYYQELFPWFLSLIQTLIVTLILFGLVSSIVNSIILGVVVKNTSGQIEKGAFDFSANFKFVISKLPSLFTAQFIIGILVVVGMLFFVVPGVIFVIMFLIVIPTIIVEQRGAFESLGRSKELVSNRWLKTFSLYLIIGIIVVSAFAIGFVFTILFSIHPIVNPLIAYIILAFVWPIHAIAITYHYYSMAARENPQTVENT